MRSESRVTPGSLKHEKALHNLDALVALREDPCRQQVDMRLEGGDQMGTFRVESGSNESDHSCQEWARVSQEICGPGDERDGTGDKSASKTVTDLEYVMLRPGGRRNAAVC